MLPRSHEVVEFWRAAGAQRWFVRDHAFDAECAARFLDAHHAAARREFESWTRVSEGALALLILLDQIPRNVFRGSAHAYATDGLAREYAHRALEAGHDTRVEPTLRVFFYLPFEHSENLADQERSLFLHRALPGENPDRWARIHHDVIRRFGRFPHRNAALGRATTAEEQAFLDAGGFAG
ncbi:MAG TPA: DUF924 family protein [Rhodanobacteraceae bacterium]